MQLKSHTAIPVNYCLASWCLQVLFINSTSSLTSTCMKLNYLTASGAFIDCFSSPTWSDSCEVLFQPSTVCPDYTVSHASCCTTTFYAFCLSATLTPFRVMSCTCRKYRKIQDSCVEFQVSFMEHAVLLGSMLQRKSPTLSRKLSLFPLIWVKNSFSFRSSLTYSFHFYSLESKESDFLALSIKFPGGSTWKHYFHKHSLSRYLHPFPYSNLLPAAWSLKFKHHQQNLF